MFIQPNICNQVLSLILSLVGNKSMLPDLYASGFKVKTKQRQIKTLSTIRYIGET